jgi:hypothetical protein
MPPQNFPPFFEMTAFSHPKFPPFFSNNGPLFLDLTKKVKIPFPDSFIKIP